MKNYTFKKVGHKIGESFRANDIYEAVKKFGARKAQMLSTHTNLGELIYMVDEWEGNGPHWTNATIPVHIISN